MQPDVEELQRELEALRAQLRAANSTARVVQLQVSNYEEIDDARRALSEHLVVEKRMASEGRPEASGETRERLEAAEQVNAELQAKLEAFPSNEDSETELASLATRLDAERSRVDAATRTAETNAEQFAIEISDTNTRIIGLEKAVGAAQAQAEDLRLSLGDRLEGTREEVRQAEARVVSRREELQHAERIEQEEVDRLLEELGAKQTSVDSMRERCGELERELTAAKAKADRLRDKVRDGQRLTAMATTDTGAEAGPDSSADHELPSGEDLEEGLTFEGLFGSPESAAPEETAGDPHDDLSDLIVASHAPGNGKAGPDDLPAAAEAATVPKGAAGATGSGSPHAAKAGQTDSAVMSYGEFIGVLKGGARILRTPKFNKVTMVDKTETVVGSLLDRADSLEALEELAPARLKPQLIACVYDFYVRGLIRPEKD